MNQESEIDQEKPWVEIAIPSRPGFSMKLDEEDVDLLQGRSVYLTKGYSCIKLNRKLVYIHRLVMQKELEESDKNEIDHVNMDRLDNRKANLRLCSRQENQQNRQKQKGQYSSRFKGVSWHKRDQKWQARISINGKRKHLGYFTDELEAAQAYNNACELYHNEFARPNLIEQVLDQVIDRLKSIHIEMKE